MIGRTAVALLSGGMDSTTLAWYLRGLGFDLHLLSVDYGQRHKKELEFAARQAWELGADHDVIDLTSLTSLLSGSALTDDAVDVPHGHYAADNMKRTVVPNRNATMLAIAYAVAGAKSAHAVAAAVHAGDHFVYPDCRPEFIRWFEAMQVPALEDVPEHGQPIPLVTPFLHMTKEQIAALGSELGVDYVNTWSCYEGQEIHCGECGTCVERKEAFHLAEVADPTTYRNPSLAVLEAE